MKRVSDHPIVRSAMDFLKSAEKPRIIVALSGGPDSVALMLALAEAGDILAKRGEEAPVLIAAHCNFHLRGEESDRDADFAARLCADNGIEMNRADFDTMAYCRDKKVSVELGARQLRHGWFRKLCDQLDALLATGHNADDNAETLFLNLMRGSGSRGLRGMLPRNGHIIRPLLKFTRAEIIAYLDAKEAHYVTDSTNLASDYRRNFIRHEIMPLLRSRWPGADKALANSLKCLADDNAIVEQALSEAIGHDHLFLAWESVARFAAPNLLIFRWLSPFGGTTAIADEIARQLPDPRPGACWHLPARDDIAVRSSSRGLHIISSRDNSARYRWIRKEIRSAEDFSAIRSTPPDQCCLPDGEDNYEWKTPEAGMRIHPLGMKGSRLVADTVRDACKEPGDRHNIKVLCRKNDGTVIWIPGIRRSRFDLIDDSAEYYYLLTE